MKKFIISTLLVVGFCNVYSQESNELEQKVNVPTDTLRQAISTIPNGPLDSFKTAIDSIEDLVTAINAKAHYLKDKIKIFEKDTAYINMQAYKVDEKLMKIKEVELQQRKDSIILLSNIIDVKNQQMKSSEVEYEKKQQQKYNEGLQTAYKSMIDNYEKSPLDSLIHYSTLQTVNRDLLLLGHRADSIKSLLDLKAYFLAEQVLEERYDEQKVKNAQKHVSSITQSDLSKVLNDRLDIYILCSDGLKVTITKIIELDKKFIANDDHTQEAKLKDVLNEFAWYFRNYRFNFTDYPYLSDIVLDLMKLKQKDANENIEHLLMKL